MTLWNEIKSIGHTRQQLRSFGVLVGGVLLAIGAFLYWRASGAAPIVTGVGALLVLTGLVVPRVLKPVYIPWMALAVLLGFVMTRVILTVVFVVLFVPIGLIMRLVGRDPLSRKIDREADTYWKQRPPESMSARERMTRYF